MIRLENLTKIFHTDRGPKVAVDNVSLTLPSGGSLALLGRNGAGKTTLLQMISGAMEPTYGQILSDGTISWPVGFAGAFHPDLTGAQNARFIARVYGADTEELIDFVHDFAELGDNFYLPVRGYSSGMRSRLAFGVSMAVHFDTYLIDEVAAVGDASFKDKSNAVLKARLETSSVIVVSHSMGLVRQLCTRGAVLEKGKLTLYEDIDEAIEEHERHLGVAAKRAG
jgi:capsular polysaccharide transport system ATP-binding protein